MTMDYKEKIMSLIDGDWFTDEQKSKLREALAETDDDSRIRKNIIKILSDLIDGVHPRLPFGIYEEAIKWIKPELGEDMRMIDAIIYGIEEEYKSFDTPYLRQHCMDKIEWLQKLRHRLTRLAYKDEYDSSKDTYLEDEIHRWVQNRKLYCYSNTIDDVNDTARYFFELGLNSKEDKV